MIEAKYLYLKYQSVPIELNDYVKTGDILGVVGSSGHSTAPHLHMSVYDADGHVIDPFQEGLFASPPAYHAPLSLMEVIFKEGSFSGANELKDPPTSQISRVLVNSAVSVGLNMANGMSGDTFHIKMIDPSGHVHWEISRTFAGTERHTYWIYNVNLSSEAGIWTWEVDVNGAEHYSRTFEAYDASLPPTASIVAPIDQSHYIEGVTVPIRVHASCPAGISQVDFFANNSFFNTDKTVPYSRQLEGLATGTHTIAVNVLCRNGLATSEEVRVIVDPVGTPLVVNLNTPRDSDRYVSGDAIDADVTTSDDRQVDRVEMWVDDTIYAEADRAPWMIDLSHLSPGDHVIQAKAIDVNNSVWSSVAVNITVVPSTKPEFILDVPLPGENGKDWVIHHYYDVSEGESIDYMGGHKTYPGHRAVDFDSASFEQMDNNMPILAAAPGVVVKIVENVVEDRNRHSGRPPANVVWVKHDNGLTIRYAHLKYNSVPVILNQVIHTGDVLGVIGSSGTSSFPHLHMSIFDDDINGYDPFSLKLWRDPPLYELPVSSMDIVYAEGDSLDLLDPPTTDMTKTLVNSPIVVGLNLANGMDGDYFSVQLIDPDGDVELDKTGYSSSGDVHIYRTYRAMTTNKAGIWTWHIDINGTERHTHEFRVYNQETITLHPTADTYVSDSKPDRNFGSKNQIITDAAGNIQLAYLKFDLSGYQVFGATLRLSQRYHGGKNDDVEVRLISDAEWDESQLTWNNKPFDTGTLIGREYVETENKGYSFDLGSHLNSENAIITLRVSGTLGNVHKWKSREHSDQQPPELIIRVAKIRDLEAEAGILTAPMQEAADPSASGGRYVVVPDGVGSNYMSPGGPAKVRFVYHAARPADYEIWARTIAPNGGSNSFYVVIDDGAAYTWHTPRTTDWQWHLVRTVSLGAGGHDIDFRLREDGTRLDKIIVQPVSGEFEAETGILITPMQEAFDPNASGGAYVTVPDGVGSNYASPGGPAMVRFAYVSDDEADYNIWARTLAPNGGSNSFYVVIDDGAAYTWHTPRSPNWEWHLVRTVRLNASAHDIDFRLREDGTHLDQIIVTDDLDFYP